jgi:Na+/H+-dicarboxylate symporter
VIDWLQELPVGWLIVVVFAGTAVVAGGIYAAIARLAVGERGLAFKALSPGMLPTIWSGSSSGSSWPGSGATSGRPGTR